MAGPGEDYQSWSTTATDNGDADALINWVEGQARASVNNSARGMMAAHAKNRNLLNGSIVTTGTANAQAFLSGISYTTVPTGLVVKLKIGPGLTNTASITLDMDGTGAVLVKTALGENLLGGEFIAGSYTDLLYNGTSWVFLYSREFIDFQLHGGGGIILGKQVFSTPGSFTYTPTPNMECCIIECIGGGGSGAGVGAATTFGANASWFAGGGGSGGYSRKYASAADIGLSQAVLVGAGGSGTSGGSFVGNNGGPSAVGTLCGANGGSGGGTGGALIGGGAGATPATGDITSAGAPGMPGILSSDGQTAIWSGAGGSSIMGGGAVAFAPSAAVAANGNPASNYGSGGGGAVSHTAGAGAAGGAGSGGIVIITEFAGRGSPGRDGATGPIGPPGPTGSGTGDVLRAGIPTSGQLASWTDASHIQGVSVSSAIGSVAITNVVIQKFTASGTYTPTAGMKYCIIECVGGGGGGAGVGGGGTNSNVGGGGGSGGYSRKLATATAIGASKTVTIGTGGDPGPGGGALGGAGLTTSVGSLCIANGGSPGGGGGANTGAGAGGAAGTGDLAAVGAPGQAGIYGNVSCPCGGGGSSMFGGGAVGNSISANGIITGGTAPGFGGGGGGGVSHFVAPGAGGGSGGAGIVVITEYI
jgi:hypothetical protein